MTTQQNKPEAQGDRAELIAQMLTLAKTHGALSTGMDLEERTSDVLRRAAVLLAADEKAGGEVVAWIDKENLPIPAGQSCPVYAGPGPANFNRAALYNRPQAAAQSVPLTDEQVTDLVVEHLGPRALSHEKMSVLQAFEEGIAAAEAAHGITGKE